MNTIPEAVDSAKEKQSIKEEMKENLQRHADKYLTTKILLND